MPIVKMIRSSMALRLNVGNRESNGTMIVRSVNLNGILPDSAPEKLWEIVVALAPLLAFPVYRFEQTIVNQFEP